jgi:hypothetical protein
MAFMKFFRPASVFVAAGLVAVCLLFGVMSKYEYPVWDGDSECFLPVAISLSHGDGLVNPIWRPMNVYDESHPERLTWHGFLYPMLLAWLTPSPTYIGIRKVVSGIWILTLLLSSFAIYKKVSRPEPLDWKHGCLLLASSLGIAGLLSDGGRPELLVSLFLAAGLALAAVAPSRSHWLIFGSLLGLMMATSPVPAFLGILVLGVYACARLRVFEAIRFLLGTYSVGLAVFLLCFAMYPFSLKAWLIGMALHSKHAVIWIEGGLLHKMGEGPILLLFYSLLIIGCIAGLIACVKYWRCVGWRSGFIIFLGLLIGATYYFAIRSPGRSYNMMTFSPVIIFLLVTFYEQTAKNTQIKQSNSIYFAILFVCALCSLGFVRQAAVFPYFIKNGVSYSSAKEELNRLIDSGESVGVTSGLFSLTEAIDRIRIFQTEPDGTYLFVQQVNHGQLLPPKIPGYTMVKNTFSEVRPTLFGIKIANTCSGYNFAIYRLDK